MGANIYLFVQKMIREHKYLSFFLGISLIGTIYIMILVIIQSPLQRRRNLVGVLSMMQSQSVFIYHKPSQEFPLGFQPLKDGNLQFKQDQLILFSGLSANTTLYWQADRQTAYFFNVGTDSQIGAFAREILP